LEKVLSSEVLLRNVTREKATVAFFGSTEVLKVDVEVDGKRKREAVMVRTKP
jgi:hypothetical protein